MTTRNEARYWLSIAISVYITLFDAPVRGGSRRNIAITVGMKKVECFGYPMVKKIEDKTIRSGRIHERDGRTDTQTPHDDIGRVWIESRSKKTSAE